MKNYHHDNLKDFAVFLQYLNYLHSPAADEIFTELSADDFNIDWYNCSQEDAKSLLLLLNLSKMIAPLIETVPQVVAIFPPKTLDSLSNILERLNGYEPLLERLSNQVLTASQIETELIKISMLHRRNEMRHLYQNL